MPFQPTAAWYSALAEQSDRTPVFILTIGGASVRWSSHPVKGASSSPPLVPGTLDVSDYATSRVYPGEGRYTTGELSALILDTGGWVSYLLGTERVGASRWYMQPVTLQLGEVSLAESQYQTVWSGYLTNIELHGGLFEIKALNKLSAWDNSLMTNCWSIDGKVANDDSAAPYDSFDAVGEFVATGGLYTGSKIKFTSGKNSGSEYTVASYSAPIGTIRKFTLTPAATFPIGNNDEFTVYNYVRLVGNPINIWIRCLLGSFALSGSVQTDWPLVSASGVSPTGLSFTSSDLDVAQIQAERDLWVRDAVFDVTFTEDAQARSFFQDQIFKPLQGYPAQSTDGKFRIRMARPAPPASATSTIDDSDMLGEPRWSRLTDDIVNRVTVYGDRDAAADREVLLVDAETWDTRYVRTAIPQARQQEIKTWGLSTSQDGASIAGAMAGRILGRYGTGGPENVQIRGGPALMFYEGGERVFLTHPRLPNLSSGVRGKTAEIFEVLEVKVEAKTLRVTMTLQSFFPAYRPAFIAPDSASANYSAATALEKKCAYLYDSGSTFSDGGQAYVVI